MNTEGTQDITNKDDFKMIWKKEGKTGYEKK